MSRDTPSNVVEQDPFLINLGSRVKALRRAAKMSRRQVAEISNVSQRFLSQFESGEGNISIKRFRSICEALNISMDSLLQTERSNPAVAEIVVAISNASPAQLTMIQEVLELHTTQSASKSRIALIGLRGAGKSTLAPKLADEMGYAVVELNQEIKKTTGLDLGEVFSLYGYSGYRRLEREALERIATSRDNVVVTTGGGIVSDATTYRYLLSQFLTVWVCTSPEEHLHRVIAQGDKRPIENSDSPMQALTAILLARQPLYARAAITIDTSGQDVEASAVALIDAISRYR